MSQSSLFLQGVFQFEGHGLDKPKSLTPSLSHTVPKDHVGLPLYARAGNSSSEMICLVLMKNGKPVRYFPVGAKGSFDVGLHIVEENTAGTVFEVCLAAPEGLKGTVIVDFGLSEI
jgi:assimilatory nitrate reductase catalytic subunit